MQYFGDFSRNKSAQASGALNSWLHGSQMCAKVRNVWKCAFFVEVLRIFPARRNKNGGSLKKLV